MWVGGCQIGLVEREGRRIGNYVGRCEGKKVDG